MKSKKNDAINPANFITLFRLLLGFPIFYLTFIQNKVLSVSLFIIFLLLDILDGFVARKLNCETRFGRIFDFVADGFVGFVILVILLINKSIPDLFLLLVAVPLVLFFIALVIGIIISKNTFVKSRWSKLNGVAYYVLILLFMIGTSITVKLSYLFLVYFYVYSITYFYDVLSIKKGNKKNIPPKK